MLVTGAAGLIGRELCGVLAERGHAVTALVHRSPALARNDGRPLPTTPWTGNPLPNGIATLAGDVALPFFGLLPSHAERLAATTDLIVHAAALTSFTLEPAEYDRVNRAGAAHALGLATVGGARIPLLQVSTAYVCGERDGPVPEAPPGPTTFANGYEASKAAAETLLLASGHPIVIARPSIVVGAWADGAIGAFTGLYQLIRLVTEGRIRTLPAAPHATLDLVPIDHVVAALAHLAERMDQATGRIVHLASGTPVPVAALRPLALAFPHLHAPSFVPPGVFKAGHRTVRERQLDEQMAAYDTYLRRNPIFATANLAALGGPACPPTDAAFLRRIIAHGIEAGFLPTEGSRRARTLETTP